MDIQLNTLLVALMFITILSMGIGNILMSLADIFNHATASRRSRSHIAWIVLLLLVHFNLFWQTKAILDVEDWEFGGFLLTMAGPVLLFLATSILLTSPPEDDQEHLTAFFVGLGRRFFLFFAILQAWIIMIGITLTGSFVASDITNAVFIVLAVTLAFSSSERLHNVGIILAWAMGVASFTIRWIVQ
jgi:hypothetical protein